MALSYHALPCHRYGVSLERGAGSLRTCNFKRRVHLCHKHRNLIHALSTDCNVLEAKMQGLLQHPAPLLAGVPGPEDELTVRFRAEESRRRASFPGSEQVISLKKAWWTTGIAMVGWFGGPLVDHAIAAQDAVTTTVSKAATKIAPAWIAPTVLAFPVVSYFLFAIYRTKVNPYAKLTDWVFGLVAMAILGNLILIATVGVRLY